MSVSYNSKKIIPAPLITINKQYQKPEDGSKVGVLYNITLTGTLLPFRGSPSGNYSNIDDSFWTLGGNPPDEPLDVTAGADFDRILRKQEALRHLFRDDGKSLEWQPAGGQPVVKCNPRVIDLSFPEGNWVDRSEYSISFETDWIIFTGAPSGEDIDRFETPLIQNASENWSFAEVGGFEGNAFQVTHNVSAKGIIGYDENSISLGPAWQHAKDWVDTKADGTIDTIIMSGAIGDTTFKAGSFTSNTNIDEKTGDYSVDESWILSSETTYIEKRFSCTKALLTDTFSVRYDGTIFGIEDGGNLGSDEAITQAKAQVPTDAEAKTEAENSIGSFLEGNVLSESPTSKNIGINNRNGTVTYSFEWGADTDTTFSRSCEATLDFNKSTGIYTVRLSCDIVGQGDTSSTRLINAKAAILSDAAALALALSLIGDSLPGSVTIVSTVVSKSSSFNENTGSVRTGYSWTSTTLTDPSITTQSNFPINVSAIILIPGKTDGPIIQDMGTQSQRIITVTLTSENNVSKPNNAVTIALMDSFAEADFNVGDAATWLLNSDQDNFNISTGRYNRVRSYIVT